MRVKDFEMRTETNPEIYNHHRVSMAEKCLAYACKLIDIEPEVQSICLNQPIPI